MSSGSALFPTWDCFREGRNTLNRGTVLPFAFLSPEEACSLPVAALLVLSFSRREAARSKSVRKNNQCKANVWNCALSNVIW